MFIYFRYWNPSGQEKQCIPRALVFLSHGFSEHLGNSNQTINNHQLKTGSKANVMSFAQ